MQNFDSALHKASAEGDSAEIQRLFAGDYPVNSQLNRSEKNGMTPLLYACQTCDADIIKLLLDNGADQRHCAMNGENSLHICCSNGNVEAVALLLSKDLDSMEGQNNDIIDEYYVNAKNRQGKTPFLLALENGNIDIIRALINHRSFGTEVVANFDNIDKGSNSSLSIELTAFLYASAVGNVPAMQLLLARSANISATAGPQEHYASHFAASEGHDEAVLYLLSLGTSLGISPDIRNKFKRTPLHCATLGGHVSTSKILIDGRANVNAMNAIGWTPLQGASCQNHIAVMELLLSHGAKVNRDYISQPFSCLHAAMLKGRTEAIRLLVEKGADLTARTKKNNFTVLHLGVQGDHLRAVSFILSYACSRRNHIFEFLIKGRDMSGMSCLHIAAKSGKVDMANLLMDYGSDVNDESLEKFTPLHLAVESGHLIMVRYLIDNGSDIGAKTRMGHTPLSLAITSGHFNIVSSLLAKGASANDSWGALNSDTPLHLAARCGCSNICKVLITNKASISARGQRDLTPLHYSAGSGLLDVVKLLVEEGASVNAVACDGDLPIHLAARNGHVSIVQMFLEKGVEINQKGRQYESPLHCSVSGNFLDLTVYLLGMSADISSTAHFGYTPLHAAAQYGSIDAANLLLEKARICTATDEFLGSRARNGYTPLHSAALSGHIHFVGLLLQRGATLSSKAMDGYTPLHCAIAGKSLECTIFLIKKGADLSDSTLTGLIQENFKDARLRKGIAKHWRMNLVWKRREAVIYFMHGYHLPDPRSSERPYFRESIQEEVSTDTGDDSSGGDSFPRFLPPSQFYPPQKYLQQKRVLSSVLMDSSLLFQIVKYL